MTDGGIIRQRLADFRSRDAAARKLDRQAVDGRSVELLTAAIAKSADGRNDVVVIVSADALSTHQSVINVMESSRIAGYSQISFTTQTRK